MTTNGLSELAIAGPVTNGASESAFDWATFLCEYADTRSPLRSGLASALRGHGYLLSKVGFEGSAC